MLKMLNRVRRYAKQHTVADVAMDRALQTVAPEATILLFGINKANEDQLVKFTQAYPRATLLVVGYTNLSVEVTTLPGEVEELHISLQRFAKIDVIVDFNTGNQAAQNMREFLYYLRENGIYLAHFNTHEPDALRLLIEETVRLKRQPNFDPNTEAAITKVGLITEGKPNGTVATARLAAAMDKPRWERHYVILRKRGMHLIKVRDKNLDKTFATTRGLSWVVEQPKTEPASLSNAARLHLNHERFAYRFPNAFDLPVLKVRTYHDVICARRQVVYRDKLFLPDTFRLTGQPYLRNVAIQDVDKHFAKPNPVKNPPLLSGAYYHLDTEYPGVYGHLVTDMVGRLWAWHEIKAAEPNLKLLMCTRADKEDVPSWVRAMLRAYGIVDDDITVLRGTRRVERLYAVTPQFVNYENGYVHPAITAVWQRLQASLLPQSTIVVPERVFISRPEDGDRACRNREQVEALFASQGHVIMRPEQLPLPDQVALFTKARHIAGYGGSGMLNTIFSDGIPKNKLIINPWTHHPINEYLISGIYGDDITYLYQKPEVAKKTPDFPRGPFHSPYTFDFDQAAPLLTAYFNRS